MKRILIIEDEPDIRESLEEMLTMHGYETHGAPNGKVGFVLLSTFQPDLVISDLMMPEMGGIDFLQSINKYRKSYPVDCIVLTAVNDKDIIAKAKSIGAKHVMLKPFRLDKLLEVIKALL